MVQKCRPKRRKLRKTDTGSAKAVSPSSAATTTNPIPGFESIILTSDGTKKIYRFHILKFLIAVLGAGNITP